MSHLNRQERIGTGLAAGSMLLVGGSVAASSLLGGYPVLGGQGIRYLVAGLLLAAWAQLRGKSLPRPTGREWAWLAGLAVIGLAGCSVLLIEATQVSDPASVGVVIGAAPLVIVIAAVVAGGSRPSRRVLLAAAVVTAGSAAAQLGGATGLTWNGTGLLLSVGALGGAAGASLLAAPVLPRLGALAVTIYACGLAGILLLAAAAVARSAGGPPILRLPTMTQLAALSYLAVAVTAVVFIAWYAAMKRLGVDRTGLFNGLIPIASLAAVALVGAGAIRPLQVLAALTVLAGVILGLDRTPPPADDRAGLVVATDQCLVDRDYAQWTGTSCDAVVARWGSVDRAPGVEPRSAVRDRAVQGLTDIARRCLAGTVMVVSHDAVNREVLAAFDAGLGDPDTIPQDNGCFNTLTWHSGRWAVLSANELPS
jgi:drug/metabolite transporter (DMT)-like permease